MRFPFFRFGRSGGPVRLAIPELIETLVAVYFASDRTTLPDSEEMAAWARSWFERSAAEPVVGMLCDYVDRGLAELSVQQKGEHPQPPLEFVRHFGATEEQQACYERATHVVAVVCRYTPGLAPCGLWAGLGASRAVAEALDGVVFDPLYPRFLERESDSGRPPLGSRLAVSEHIAVPFSVDRRGLGWMTTTAMAKFGLPNLELSDVPPDLPDGLMPVINAVAQTLAETAILEAHSNQGELRELRLGRELRIDIGQVARAFGSNPPEPEEGVRGWTTVGLKLRKPRRGLEPFLQLVPPRHFPAGQGEWLHSVLSDLLRSARDVRTLPADSRAMRDAHARAVAEVPQVKARFQAGLRAGETLHVKHGFPTTSGGHEYMWVVVNSWMGNRIRGQLASEPQLRVDLRAGQAVALNDADIFDWLLSSLDGRREGGYTNFDTEPEDDASSDAIDD
jgi:uncharacterized protein YegJ (DUF2314 family)